MAENGKKKSEIPCRAVVQKVQADHDSSELYEPSRANVVTHPHLRVYIYNQIISEICVTSHRPNYRYALYVMANKMAMKT